MASSKLKTIILRFRDLSVSDTIQRHNDICESLGYVWWGWWSKPQEKIPFDEFALLERKAHEDDGFEWFLFDSGKKCLYKALCTDIRYKTTGERMECPEKDKTPSYYSDSIYLAWFKFAQITGPLQNSEALSLLRKHSYLRVDHFFESERSAFTPFYNKRVYSLDELADQQRTIWFIRNFEKGDSSHEIHSFSSSLNDDKNVDQEFRILPTQDVLWISDLHFSNRHHAFGILPGSDNRLQTRLHKELSELNQKEHTLSHIIISGDLTFEASKEEYASALEFVNFMRSTYNLNDNCYSICPGNHDLKFSEKPYAEDDKVTIAYDSSKEAYIDFYRQVFGADPTESLYSIRRFLTPDLVPIEVIAINSCLLQQDKDHFRGMGYVGNDQRNEIERKLALTNGKKVFRILVMHHHLMPVMFSEEPKVSEMYSLTLDSEAISQFVLRNNINVVLHGHAHKEFYSEIVRISKEGSRKKYHIIGIGSAGATATDLSDGRKNMFGLLSFSKDSLCVTEYTLNANGESSREIASYTIPYFETCDF